MTTPVAIGIDLGGTRLRAALVAADGTVSDRRDIPTPVQDEATLVGAISTLIGDLGAHLPVGVGVAGLVTADGIVRYGPSIPVRDVPLRSRVEEVTSGTVVIANDASVAAYGEQQAGAGRDHRDVVLFTLGTGVGGGVVVGGRLVVGTHGFGGELGHLVVQDEGRQCPCGNRGCIEAYASGTAIGATAREQLAATDQPSSLRTLPTVRGQEVTNAAHEGDAFARSVLEEAGRRLGQAAALMVNALDPSLVLLGGGAARAMASLFIPAAREALATNIIGHPWREAPSIEVAVLGDDAGIVGAALLAAHEHARSAGDTLQAGGAA